MITAPYPIAPPLGPLPAPSEEELVGAYPELRDHALTLPWAAEALGLQPARLIALARSGELVVVPGPWPMRQAHAGGLGYLLPAWQLAGGRLAHPAVSALIAAAARRGWTSLELHRFMTAPPADGEPAPADLLHAGKVERVLALVRGDSDPQREPPNAARPCPHLHSRRGGAAR